MPALKAGTVFAARSDSTVVISICTAMFAPPRHITGRIFSPGGPFMAAWLTGRANSMIQFPCPAVAISSPLEDAAEYIQTLPEGRASARGVTGRGRKALLLVVELNAPTMMARIGVMRALNRHVDRTFNSSRKDTHWSRRKFKRDW
jgi:hypothetical protein